MEPIPIKEEENKIANEESIYLYGYLRKKYCNDNIKDLDIVMNSLCFALCRLIAMHVAKGEEHILIEIIKKTIESPFLKEK
jgi:hypothetical protein